MDALDNTPPAFGGRVGRFFRRACWGTLIGLALYSMSILWVQEDFEVSFLVDSTGSFRTIHVRCFSTDDTRNSRVLSFYRPLLRLAKVVGWRFEIRPAAELSERIPVGTVVYVDNLPEGFAESAPFVTVVDRVLD